VQNSQRRPGRGRKSSRSHAFAIALHTATVFRSTPLIDWSEGVAMSASGFDKK
jgi:hypothetical protein